MFYALMGILVALFTLVAAWRAQTGDTLKVKALATLQIVLVAAAAVIVQLIRMSTQG